MVVKGSTANKVSIASRVHHRFESMSGITKGVSLALCSTALFTLVGVIVRMLSDSLDVFQILLFRQLVFGALLLPAIIKNIDVLIRPTNLKLHSLRICGAFISLYCGFLTVSNIPFADATALGFTQVLFVALLSKAFLSEGLSGQRILAIVIGFIGVMMVVQPSFTDADFGYTLIGLLSALGAAVAVLCVRKVALTESKIALMAYQAIFVGFMALVPALLSWQWPTPTEFTLLIGVGVISSLAQWIGVTAYKYGQANVIANVEYGKMIYSIALGYLLFSEIPNWLALIGVSTIIFSAILPLFFRQPSSIKEVKGA